MNQYLSGLAEMPFFTKASLLENVKIEEPGISTSSFYRMMRGMISRGEIIRVGRDAYTIPENKVALYSHEYLEIANSLADYLKVNYPKVDFRIFEIVQLNDFLNHQIGRNVIFLFIEDDLGDFLFEGIRDRYNNNVLLNPTSNVFHQYWKEDMIVIEKLTTEAPKGKQEFWHTDLEKILVDIMADKLIADSFSESEYPLIYESAFNNFVIDESKMFRYAKRRTVDQKIKDYLRNNTTVQLRTIKNYKSL